MNDYQFKVVKLAGDFVWHAHSDTDETFIVLEGELRIDVRGVAGGDGPIILRAGQLAVVPRGVEHQPCAIGIVTLLMIEPPGLLNTGVGATRETTSVTYQWI